ncbi:hypothetical protein [Sphaerospermopsis sp. LEGE 08334]|jgi:hypothetical protein|uniref:hypothetical protein n=1 Tax=Sphaerospermopsis sp. LEGE 08334 TaxID=1828651 RepID=UPI00187FF741|nr:hypothetical protein [Sphaerospermopsis sp. LEGE 08334]MBE9057389.1 hypothetical protein [Sphaerospermopsis sp. LEGE 08334]
MHQLVAATIVTDDHSAKSRRGEALGKQPWTKLDNLSPECFALTGVKIQESGVWLRHAWLSGITK